MVDGWLWMWTACWSCVDSWKGGQEEERYFYLVSIIAKLLMAIRELLGVN